MAKASPIQTSFASGEFSPRLFGRVDIQKYKTGMSVCLNALPLVQGPWVRRSGSQWLRRTRYSGSKVCIIYPFQYSTSQAYVCEFGDQYVRFQTPGGVLTETPQSIVGITSASPGVVDIGAPHGFNNGDRIILNGISGMTQLNGQEVIAQNVTANTFEIQNVYGIDINTTVYDAYTTGGTAALVVETATPYLEADVADLKFVQSADTLYIYHPDFEIRKLTRTSATAFALTTYEDFDGPYDIENATATTLTPSGTTGAITITASGVTGINNDTGFQTTDVGRIIRIYNGGTPQWGYAEITGHTSAVLVNATVLSTLGGTGATTQWRLGLWSDTTGHPRSGTFYDDRLFSSGGTVYPQRVDGSNTSDYENMRPTDIDGTVPDSRAVAFTLNANKVNAIQWLIDDEQGLLVGTTGGVWTIRASSLNEAITPSNVSGKRSSPRGVSSAAPIKSGEVTLYIDNAKRKVRELSYSFEKDGLVSPDLSLLAEHLTAAYTLEELAYQQDPQSVVWVRRSDGNLLGMTYDKEQAVTGWHQHELGGVSDAQGNPPVIESMAVIPSQDGTRDELYMVVKRYVDGTTERYLERFFKLWEPGDLKENAFYLDCANTVTLGPGTELSGLLHLEGETLDILVDGKRHPQETVSNGKITLDVSATTVTYGYGYTSKGGTLPIEAGAADGSAQSKLKRNERLGIRIYDTLGLEISSDDAAYYEVLPRDWGAQVWGASTDLFTGVLRSTILDDTDREGQIWWRCTGPFPATVLALMPQVITEDDS